MGYGGEALATIRSGEDTVMQIETITKEIRGRGQRRMRTRAGRCQEKRLKVEEGGRVDVTTMCGPRFPVWEAKRTLDVDAALC